MNTSKMKGAEIVTASIGGLVRATKNVQSQKDGRKKCDYYLYSYYCGSNEYRRSYEVKRGAEFTPPRTIQVIG